MAKANRGAFLTPWDSPVGLAVLMPVVAGLAWLADLNEACPDLLKHWPLWVGIALSVLGMAWANSVIYRGPEGRAHSAILALIASTMALLAWPIASVILRASGVH